MLYCRKSKVPKVVLPGAFGIIITMGNIFFQSQTFFISFSRLLQKYIGGVGAPKLDYSWLIILFFIFIFFLVGFGLGRSRIMLSLVGLYIAAFLEVHFIYFKSVSAIFKNSPQYIVHIGIFLIIYGIVVFLLNRSFLKQRLTLKEASIFSATLMTIVEIGFLASLIFSYLPSSIATPIPQKIAQFFSTKNAQFWWALVPIVVLIFLKKEKKSIHPDI